MKENRIIPLVALIVAVVGLGIGFAAFTSTLTISSSAQVNPASTDFTNNVGFSTSSTEMKTGTLAPNSSTYGKSATLAKTTISGIEATFTAPGQSVTYSANLVNLSAYTAYLNAVTFGSKTCTAGTGATQALVTAACGDISMSVKIGTNTYTSTNNSISSVSIASTKYLAVTVKITYASCGDRADGPFTVSFGNLTATVGTAD